MTTSIFRTISALAAIASLLCGCEGKTDDLNAEIEDVTEIVVTPSSATIQKGSSTTIEARIGKWNASLGRTIEWASDDASIASVNQDGVVTGLAAGETDILASSGGKTGTCHVTVTDPSVQ